MKTKGLTTGAGCPVAHNNNVATAGPRGPMLMQDVWYQENLFSRPCRAGERAGETTAGGILGRRDNIIIRWTKFQNWQLRPLCRAG